MGTSPSSVMLATSAVAVTSSVRIRSSTEREPEILTMEITSELSTTL